MHKLGPDHLFEFPYPESRFERSFTDIGAL
jgi:hypothetical protein